jgi:peptide/nickel transport system permease protein
VIIALVEWTSLARVVRAGTLTLKERDFVRAAWAIGAGPFHVLTRHVLPNLAAPVTVTATLTVGRVILFESVLSFLGFGIVPPTPSWGNMLTNAQELMTAAPALALWPGLLIFVTVILVNMVGEGMQHAFDVRSDP